MAVFQINVTLLQPEDLEVGARFLASEYLLIAKRFSPYRILSKYRVNLLIAVPFIAYFFWRREPVLITRRQLLASALFAASFGMVEGMVVVYLRAVLAAAAGYGASLVAVAQFSRNINPAMQESAVLPVSLLKVEVCREAATILMLITVALLGTVNRPGRWAMFLWTFAIWDLTYYATLCATIRWPSSLTDSDVLFLIPIPWISPVWFPLLVSTLCIAAILQSRRSILRQCDTDAG